MILVTKTRDVVILCVTAIAICLIAGHRFGQYVRSEQVAGFIRADYELSTAQAGVEKYQRVADVFGCIRPVIAEAGQQ